MQHARSPGRSWMILSTLTSHQRQGKHPHLGFGDALDAPCPVPVCLNGHDDRLCTTGRHRASAIGVIVHPQTHCHDFCLHLPNRWEDVWMERIGDGIALKSSDEHLGEIIPSVYPLPVSHPYTTDNKTTYDIRHPISSHVSNPCEYQAPCPS